MLACAYPRMRPHLDALAHAFDDLRWLVLAPARPLLHLVVLELVRCHGGARHIE